MPWTIQYYDTILRRNNIKYHDEAHYNYVVRTTSSKVVLDRGLCTPAVS